MTGGLFGEVFFRARFFDGCEGGFGGAGDDFAGGFESGAVAGAVPGFFGIVPVNEASEVGAGGGDFVEFSVFVARAGEFLAVDFQDFSLSAREGCGLFVVQDFQAVFDEIVGEVGVLFDEVPGGAEGFSADGKEVGPVIFSAEERVTGHDSGERSEQNSVADVTGCDELSGDDFSDEGQGVVGLNHLAGPAAVDFGFWEEGVELCFDALEAGLGAGFLAGLVVVAAVDDVVAGGLRVDSDVVVGVVGVTFAGGGCGAFGEFRARRRSWSSR